MKSNQKSIRITLSDWGEKNIEEIVESTFEICRNNEDVNGVQMSVNQVDAEKAIKTLESLTETEYRTEVTSLVITVTDTDLRD
jgi:spore cortex formation protein SpoVR/YcgB (stage V sporulation)